MPFQIRYKYRGKQCFEAADKYITDNNIVFDLIHAHFSWPSGYVAKRLNDKYKAPTILTIHENRAWLIEESKHNYIREVWKKVDGIIRVNQIDLDIIEKYNSALVSIPNGYSPSLYSGVSTIGARSKLGLRKNEKIIFSLGHLIERKGFLDLLNAVKLLNKKRNDFTLYIGAMAL